MSVKMNVQTNAASFELNAEGTALLQKLDAFRHCFLQDQADEAEHESAEVLVETLLDYYKNQSMHSRALDKIATALRDGEY